MVLIQGQINSELYSCSECEFAFYPEQNWITRSFSDELNSLDIGSTDRTMIAADYLGVLLKSQKLRDGSFLDYGGGYGLLSRIMRDRGFKFRSHDPFTKQIFPTGIRTTNNLLEQKYDAITLIEVALHFEDPVQEFKKLLELSDYVLFTAVLTDEKLDSGWWYLSPETGQHIALFSKRTLKVLAVQLGVNITTDGKFFHVFHRDALTARASFLAKRQHLVFAIASFNAATSYLRRALSSSRSLLESDEIAAKKDLIAKRAKP